MTHIRFEEEDVMAERQASGAAASCLAPPSLAQQQGSSGGRVMAWHCAGSTRVDFDQQDRCYVLDLVSQPSQGLVAARLSNKRIKLFSLRSAAGCRCG